MTTKTEVFNECLQILEEQAVQDADESGMRGEELRRAWDPAVRSCFERAGWYAFSKRVQLERSGDTPPFGWKYYYQLPGDYVRDRFVSETGNEDDPLRDFAIEGGRIACNAETAYLVYVSNYWVSRFGDWSQAFADYVAGALAHRVGPRLNCSSDKIKFAAEVMASREGIAITFDLQQQPPRRKSVGRWARARYNGVGISSRGGGC